MNKTISTTVILKIVLNAKYPNSYEGMSVEQAVEHERLTNLDSILDAMVGGDIEPELILQTVEVFDD